MRRIVQLESQEEPSLPDLPSFSSNQSNYQSDLTFPDSPYLPPSSSTATNYQQQQQQQSINSNATPFNFTSTPLPSNSSTSTHSKSSFHSANSNQSNNTTATIIPTNKRGNRKNNFNQHFGPISTSYESLHEEAEEEDGEEESNCRELFDLPSFEDEGNSEDGKGSINRVEEEEGREDMIVLSGSGSGEDSTGGLLEEGRRFQISKPLSSRDFIVPIAPISPTSSVEGDNNNNNSNNNKISANVSIRRKSSFKSTPLTRFISDENSTPSITSNGNESPSSQSHSQSTIVPKMDNSNLELPSTFSPLRELSSNTSSSNNNNNQSIISSSGLSSPGIGRHASPHLSPHPHYNTTLQSNATHYTPKTPSPSTPDLSSQTPQAQSYATPLPSILTRTDAERRKEHLLATLRSTLKPTLSRNGTTKPKFAKGTPHPATNRLRNSLVGKSIKRAGTGAGAGAGGTEEKEEDEEEEEEDEDEEDSVFQSEDTASSLDPINNRRRANTSLPSELLETDHHHTLSSTNPNPTFLSSSTNQQRRFGGAKVNGILQAFNSQLIEENTSLVSMLGKASEEVGRLREEKRDWELSGIIGGGTSTSISVTNAGEEENTLILGRMKDLEEREKRLELKEMELEGMVRSQEGILVLKSQLGESLSTKIEEGNRILELEKSKEKFERQVEEKEKIILELRDKLLGYQQAQLLINHSDQATSPVLRTQQDDHSGISPANLIEELQREIFELKDSLSLADSKSEEFIQLQEELNQLTQIQVLENSNLKLQSQDLIIELTERDSELKELRNELVEQENEFGEKMRGLEAELLKVMEEQEDQLEKAKAELEEVRTRDELAREEEKVKLEEMRVKLKEVEDERDSLVMRLDRSGTTSELGGEGREELNQWKTKVSELESQLELKDQELFKLNSEMDEFESKVDAIDLSRNLSRQEAEERITSQAQEIQQMEEALDESTQQMVQYEEEIDQLRMTLEKERKVLASLTNQSSLAYKTKSKSPLANEILSNTRDLTIATLEEELELARNEVVALKEELDSKVENASRARKESSSSSSSSEVGQDQLRIKTLEGNKIELEATVSNLRKQVLLNAATTNSNSNATPMKYQDSSFFLPSLRGVDTPRFFDQSLYSPGTEADATIGPLHAEIHRLELIVTELQAQLMTTNVSIVTRQLEEARARILVLEGLLKERASESHESDSGTPRVTEALRAALAGVNAKLSELKSENSVLQNASSRARELSRKHKALQDDFAVARSEITTLESSLRTTRASLSTLSSEHTQSKQTLSIQLERHLTEIRTLRQTLASGISRERVLQDERGDILRGVESLQEDLGRVRRDAISLGLDLAKEVERRKVVGGGAVERLEQELEVMKRRLREHTCSADSNSSLVELKTRHSQESKGLLLMIRYLKARITREASFRIDTSYQKEYLSKILKEQKTLIDVTKATLIDLGCAPRLTSLSHKKSKTTFKAAAFAVIAISRMNAMSQAWRMTSSIKTKLRNETYPETRGRPFPRNST